MLPPIAPRPALLWAAFALATGLALPTAQARGPLEVVAKLDVKSRFPDFVSERPTAMSRGRLLYLGKGSWAKQQTQVLWRVATRQRFVVTVPLDAYLAAHPELNLDAADQRPLARRFHLVRLLYYDETDREAGVLVADHYSRKNPRRRSFLLRWDLASQRITHATQVHERNARDRGLGQRFKVLGYDHVRRDVLVAHSDKLADGRERTVLRAYKDGKARVLARFTSQRALGSSVFLFPAQRRLVLAEYAERATSGPPPRGYLVALDDGSVRALEIPPTTYGLLLGPAAQRVFAYSAQLGQLWTLDAATGKKVGELRVGALGHALGPVGKQVVLIRAHGLQLFSWTRRGLRKARFLPMRLVYPTVVNVSGSVVVGGLAVVRTGETLYVVSFAR